MAVVQITIILAAVLTIAGLCRVFYLRVKQRLAHEILASSMLLADYKYFHQNRAKIKILFLGACEFRSGINDRKIDGDAFCFAPPKAAFVEQYYLLKHSISKMTNVKLLVLSVGDNSFCYNTAHGDTMPVIFHQFIDYKELLAVTPLEKKGDLLKQRWLYSSGLGKLHYGRKHIKRKARRRIKIYKRKFSVSNIIRYVTERLSINTTGVKPKSTSREKGKYNNRNAGIAKKTLVDKMQKENKNSPTSVEVFPKESRELSHKDVESGVIKHFSHPVFDPRALMYFSKILKLCQDKGVPVIALTMPRSKKFIEIAQQKGFIAEEVLVEKIFNNPEYGSGIFRHLNFLREYVDRDDFFDAEGVELNKKGRQMFSEKLAGEINKILNRI